LKDSRDVTIQNVSAPEGEKTRDIRLVDSNPSGVAGKIERGEGVPADAVVNPDSR